MAEDKWIYVLLGMVVGVPLGMAFYKYLFSGQAAAQASAKEGLYGANYTYDDKGRLITYTPMPLGSTVTQIPTSQTTTSSVVS